MNADHRKRVLNAKESDCKTGNQDKCNFCGESTDLSEITEEEQKRWRAVTGADNKSIFLCAHCHAYFQRALARLEKGKANVEKMMGGGVTKM